MNIPLENDASLGLLIVAVFVAMTLIIDAPPLLRSFRLKKLGLKHGLLFQGAAGTRRWNRTPLFVQEAPPVKEFTHQGIHFECLYIRNLSIGRLRGGDFWVGDVVSVRTRPTSDSWKASTFSRTVLCAGENCYVLRGGLTGYAPPADIGIAVQTIERGGQPSSLVTESLTSIASHQMLRIALVMLPIYLAMLGGLWVVIRDYW